jgi:DNA-binding MarR family transcriptional regulator
MSTDYKPLGYTLIALTKYYLTILGDKLSGIPIEKYFHPFWYIAQHSGCLSQQQMAESLDIDKVAVVRIIDYLEKKGFVKRVNDLEDRRCHRLHVTAIGEKYAPIIEQALKETDELFLGEMNDQGQLWQSELLQLMQKLKSGTGNNISIDYDKIQKNEN